MVRLAGRALGECLSSAAETRSLPVLLAVPEAYPGYPPPVEPEFLEQLRTQAGVEMDGRRSKLFATGSAGAFLALREALDRLESGAEERIVVGGVDSYVDGNLLLELDNDRRLLARPVRDGFIPGEGAAFLVLARPGTVNLRDPVPIARIDEAANALEPGHRYSEQVCRGDGLTAAFSRLFEGASRLGPVQTVYSGINGESFGAKEQSAALTRHSERFAEDMAIEHPAARLGNTGAALGAMMMALAAIGLRRGYQRGPCLLWCASDRGERGAALMRRS
ncbi:MAG: beta-ketoacyl synthase N-terminal-like domain-containing protein [Polyangiaceae bacterium]